MTGGPANDHAPVAITHPRLPAEELPMTAAPAPHAPISIPDLRKVLSGPVIAPDDAAYDQARTIFYGGIDRRPAAVVRPTNASDVSQVVSLAREHGLELAVRSGGHSLAGHGTTDGGIVLDLGNLRALDLDVEGRTAWAETGLTAGEYSTAAGAHGAGDRVRRHRLGRDRRTHPGRRHRVAGPQARPDDRRPAGRRAGDRRRPAAPRGRPVAPGPVLGDPRRRRQLRRRHPLPVPPAPGRPVVGGLLLLPATPEVVASFVAEAQAAPEELSTIANVMPAPPLPFVPAEHHGRLVIMATLAYAGDPDAGQRAVAPFRALATPIADLVRPMPYPQIYPPEEEGFHPTAASRTMFVDAVDRDATAAIVEHLQASTAPLPLAQLRVLGGAMARVPAEATAFAHRASRLMVNVTAVYGRPEDAEVHQAWVDRLAAALGDGDARAYVNFLGDEGQARVREAYPGSTWERLAAVKGRYDPTNLFRLNQNIPPTNADPDDHNDPRAAA
jgi:FAD binding domain/Berberine and berberine like